MKTNIIGVNDPSILNIFKNRGVNPDSIFRLDEKALLDPFLIKNMEKAIDVVNEVITKSDGVIFIEEDADADGYSSTSLIYDYLTTCYPKEKSRFGILIHEEKSHGIQHKEVLKLVESGVKVDMVIAPDCSSNEEDVHKILEDANVRVVVLDHHDADKYSSYASAMVNPFLDDYPNKKLSGVGVCQKFADAYDRKFGFNFSKDYFDLVAIGMIGDMIEVNTLESIYMVQEGMSNINSSFLKSVYKVQSYSIGDQVTPMGIAFYVTPLINAVTRVGTIEEKVLVTKAMTTKEFLDVPSSKRGSTENDTEILQEQAVRIMTNIKSRQARSITKAMNDLEGQITAGNLNENKMVMLDTGGNYPASFNGLIANKFMQSFQKPVLVGNKMIDEEGREVFKGSARGSEKSALPKLKTFLNESDKVIYAEGHEPAHGFSIQADKKEELVNYFNEELKDLVFEPVFSLDFEIEHKDLSFDILEEITRYATFWTRGLEEPMFLIKNVPVSKDQVTISGGFDSQIVNINQGDLRYLQFGVETEKAHKLTKNEQSFVDIVGKVNIKTYKGETFFQIMMEDFEIKGAQKYFF